MDFMTQAGLEGRGPEMVKAYAESDLAKVWTICHF